ncbi:MAG: FAD-binding oxidoreductase [Aureliella sp.]
MLPTLLLLVSGILLIAATGFRAATAGVSTLKQHRDSRKRRQNDVSALRQKVEVARLQSDLDASAKADMGWRVMRVAEVVQESADCKSFYLVDPYGQTLPDFRPGQYLIVRPALAGAYQTTRCYSLSSAPDGRYWRITVKRQADPDVVSEKSPSRKGGLSAWLHDTVGAQDFLMIGGPAGQFALPEDSTRPLVLLAAGIGITPMASMLRWSLEYTPDRPVTVLFQAKDAAHWPLGETLHGWQSDAANCHVVTYFSRLEEDGLEPIARELPGTFQTGRFSGQIAASMPHGYEADFYMCGPDSWMQSMREGLAESGIGADQVHWESFGSEPGNPGSQDETGASAANVRFEHSDIDTTWQQPDQSIWELARESGVEIPSGCLSGVCGCCRVKLLEGEVAYDRNVSLELGEDECLSCVARPCGDISIDA